MYHIIRGVITAGNYKLAEIQHKIKKLYIIGDLTEEQTESLMMLASGGVSLDAERPEILSMIQALADKITVLENRIKALECIPDDSEQYPAWEPWNGISKDYQKGTIVTHNGHLWESVYEGQNVWEPGTAGQQFWVVFQK